MRDTWNAYWHRSWDDGLSPQEEKNLLLRCFAFVFLWGLLAHAYGFMQDSFSHDVLNALYADGVEVYWKMQLGRFGTVLYRRLIRLPLTMPWLLGVLSLGWMSLALFLTAKLFRLRSKALLLVIAGAAAVNLSVSAMTATYLYEMDMNMFALLAAIAAVFLWARFGWLGTALGALLTAGVMSLYQSFLSVVITLVIFYSLWQLLTGAKFKAVFLPGLRSLVMIGLGGGVYYALLRLMVRLKDIPLDTGSTNSIYQALAGEKGPGLWEKLCLVYENVWQSFFGGEGIFLDRLSLYCHAALLLLSAVLLLLFLLRGRTGWGEKLLALALLTLLPLAVNTACFFSLKDAHDLMKYAFWLLWLLPLLLGCGLTGLGQKKVFRVLAGLVLLVLLWDNVQTANALYVKKDLEQEATLSLMTRVLGRVEAEPDYVPGETPVVFVGTDGALNGPLYGFERYYEITGAEYPTALQYSHATYYYNTYAAYFRYVLNTRIRLADVRIWQAMQWDERVEAMPAYPAAGCLQEIDGVLVVKVGEPSEYSRPREG